VVVSTLLLPAAYIYLRANTNRRQPWQVEEISPASRLAMTLGRYAADVAILFGALTALNLAGLFLAWLILPAGHLDPLELSFSLWVIAGPALMGLAAIRSLFDAVPLLRGAIGDLAYFVIWIMSLAMPSANATSDTGFAANMTDPGGFVRPLIYGSGLADPGFAIGGGDVKPGRLPVDAMAGILSPGYLPSRAAWTGIALMLVVLAGSIYRPHRVRNRPSLGGRLNGLLREPAPPAADPLAPRAPRAAIPLLSLAMTEFRLIGSGRLFKLAALLAAAVGVFVPTQPLVLLLLVFALTSHAGRSEGGGMRMLAAATATNPWTRRAAFVVAGLAWSALLALPHAAAALKPEAMLTAVVIGAVGAVTASLLATVSRSAFAPRVVLLIAWYVYIAG
jgi:hypothetical protein